ncbi:MAG: response regulator, partial [Nitrospiraceae bacterium]
MTSQIPPCTVLVIDPCRETQARIADHVEGRGFSVVAAADPSTALTTIGLAAPDIVITDLFLPEGAGLALTKELRSRHEPCLVIVMAKDAPEPAVVQALRAGVVDCLHKPVAEEELAHALQRARDQLPEGLADIAGIRRTEYRLSMDSHPNHIPAVVSWLIRTTASTLSEAQRLRVRGALYELLLNAVEHGNLEMFHQAKQKALAEGRYEGLLLERLNDARLKDRRVAIQVLYEKDARCLTYRVADEGKGFMWRRF